MKLPRIAFVVACMLAGWLISVEPVKAQDAYFYPITDIAVELPRGGNLWPVQNLIQGPDFGFDSLAPFDSLLQGAAGAWVTDACGFPCDYIDSWGTPIITMDLGQDRDLSEVSVWGYASSNANGLAEFSLRFATAADGPTGYGNSINYNPTFSGLDIDPLVRQSFGFGQTIKARYVELTALDNFFEPPGDGSNGEIPGGDRVGFSEIAFESPDEIIVNPPTPIEFYEIDSIESSTEPSDLWPVSNLIQGPDVGFIHREPYTKSLGGDQGNWVTEACGFPCDYLESFDPPVLKIDLGEDVPLDEINVWGYEQTNANGVTEFSLRFATQADGPDGFGTSIDYNPTFSDLPNDSFARQVRSFDRTVTARYVEFTAQDNFFIEPGDGSNGETPGGDRMGLGEIAFPIPTAGLPGDFNNDGILDSADIDDLTKQSADGLNPPKYDLNADTFVNETDVNVWVKDLFVSWIGDANLDKEFNSRDLVNVLASGTYEADVASVWSTGDFNGDGRTNSADLVSALADGGYEQGPPQALAAVPEPTGLLLAAMALLALTVRRGSPTPPLGP
jgi:hypothetical protein